LINFQNVSFRHPGFDYALRGISLQIVPGELVAFVGPNGAGKTTLIRHMNGLLKPTDGKVTVFGVDTRKSSVAQLSRKVGIVFQNADHQLFSETVRKEVEFGLQNFGLGKEETDRRADWALTLFDLKRYENTSPMMLSGGEKKRLCFACVLAWDPDVLVMDEPTVGQDSESKEKITQTVKLLTSQMKTVVLVSHDVEFLWPLQPRTIILSGGRIIFDGSAKEAFTDESLISKSNITAPQLVELARLVGLPSESFSDIYAARDALLKSFRNPSA
jgi:energy-coupling factor transport system ATP-binding protein